MNVIRDVFTSAGLYSAGPTITGFDTISLYLVGRDRDIDIFHGISLNGIRTCDWDRFGRERDFSFSRDRVIVPSPLKSRGKNTEDCPGILQIEIDTSAVSSGSSTKMVDTHLALSVLHIKH